MKVTSCAEEVIGTPPEPMRCSLREEDQVWQLWTEYGTDSKTGSGMKLRLSSGLPHCCTVKPRRIWLHATLMTVFLGEHSCDLATQYDVVQWQVAWKPVSGDFPLIRTIEPLHHVYMPCFDAGNF